MRKLLYCEYRAQDKGLGKYRPGKYQIDISDKGIPSKYTSIKQLFT